MVHGCRVIGCNNRYDKSKSSSLSWHKFPSRSDLLQKWLAVCKLEPPSNPQKNFICSNHFLPSAYYLDPPLAEPTRKKRLLPNAEPTENLPFKGGKKTAAPKKSTEEIVMPPNVQLFCRVCFEMKNDLISLYTPFVVGECRTTIKDVLKLIQKEDDNPNYPLGVCSQCRALATAVVIFKEKLKKSTEVLRYAFANTKNNVHISISSNKGVQKLQIIKFAADKNEAENSDEKDMEGDQSASEEEVPEHKLVKTNNRYHIDEGYISKQNRNDEFKNLNTVIKREHNDPGEDVKNLQSEEEILTDDRYEQKCKMEDINNEDHTADRDESTHDTNDEFDHLDSMSDGEVGKKDFKGDFESERKQELLTEDIHELYDYSDRGKGGTARQKIPAIQHQFTQICPICRKEISSALYLRKHVRKHKSLRNYLKGKKVSKNAVFVAQPRKTVSLFNRPNITHPCTFCNEEVRIENFFKHRAAHYKQVNVPCDKCQRVFKRHIDLKVHKVYAHREVYPYTCEHCNKGFISEKNYNYHKLRHTGEELPHECHLCDRRFAHPEHLYRHKFIHKEKMSYNTRYDNKRCNTCTKKFKSIEELEEHRKTCVVKTYECPVCSKEFRVIESLMLHIRTKHREESKLVSNTVCSLCDKRVANMYIHMASHLDDKPYKCTLCPKSFILQTAFKQHQLMHSGKKPFVCSKCGKAFNNVSNMQVHERTHTGEKPYQCDLCDKAFLEKAYLKRHMRTHSKYLK